MSDDNNIKIYSATDIERYHAGKMTPGEMHALEKAALDDPFLADALEGYATLEAISISRDIDLLKKKFNERINSGKVIAMPVKKIGVTWIRAAAMIIIVGSLGWMIYQFTFNKPSEEVATVNKSEPVVAQDSNQMLTPPPAESEKDVAISQSKEIAPGTKKEKSQASETGNNSGGTIGNQEKMDNKEVVSSQPLSAQVSKEEIKVPAGISKDLGRNVNADVTPQRSEKTEDKQDMSNNQYKSSNANAMSRQAGTPQNAKQFRGQVLDANQNPLPFANITNTRDNIGTYTDAKGNFTLISPDSILNVQIKSLGFENETTQLRNDPVKNNIILQQDKQNLNEIVISNKRVNTKRAKEARIIVEEPEPADGWYNYDIYLSNNLKAPDDIKSNKISGEVDLSFEVNKNGAPVNIKIEKSLCSSCDEEAIRLVKDGPKWKKKGKNQELR